MVTIQALGYTPRTTSPHLGNLSAGWGRYRARWRAGLPSAGGDRAGGGAGRAPVPDAKA